MVKSFYFDNRKFASFYENDFIFYVDCRPC